MRDHQIGAYGAAALVFDVGIKIAAVAVLATRGDAVRACAAAVAVSRVVPVVLGVALPYARAGEGLGRVLTTAGWGRAVVAVAIGAIVAALLGFAPLLGVAAASAVVVGLTARAWLGGVTGDILGASAELTELAALVAAVVLT